MLPRCWEAAEELLTTAVPIPQDYSGAKKQTANHQRQQHVHCCVLLVWWTKVATKSRTIIIIVFRHDVTRVRDQ